MWSKSLEQEARAKSQSSVGPMNIKLGGLFDPICSRRSVLV